MKNNTSVTRTEKVAKSKKSMLALSGAALLANALGGGAASASTEGAPFDFDNSCFGYPSAVKAASNYFSSAYQNVQDTMDWCTKNPFTTAGIVLGTTALITTVYLASTGQLDGLAEGACQLGLQTSTKIANFFQDPQPALEALTKQLSDASQLSQTYVAQGLDQASNLSSQVQETVQNAVTQGALNLSETLSMAKDSAVTFATVAKSQLAAQQDFWSDYLAKNLGSQSSSSQAIQKGVENIFSQVNQNLNRSTEITERMMERASHYLTPATTKVLDNMVLEEGPLIPKAMEKIVNMVKTNMNIEGQTLQQATELLAQLMQNPTLKKSYESIGGEKGRALVPYVGKALVPYVGVTPNLMLKAVREGYASVGAFALANNY